MKVHVDRAVCTGHARCNAVAPQLFDLDDDGYCAIDEADVTPELEQAATAAVRSCPEHAITLQR